MFQIEFYETEQGIQPAKEFLLSLDTKMRAKWSIQSVFFRTMVMNCGSRIQNLFLKAFLNSAPELDQI